MDKHPDYLDQLQGPIVSSIETISAACSAGTFTKKLYNNLVTLEKWCDDPASAGQYVVVSRGECNVQVRVRCSASSLGC
jgi:hypothetical protein